MKKVLVFGGAGFIGANLCRKLLKEGYFVTCFDNFSSGNRANIDKINNENFEIINRDICKNIELENDYDYVINLACPASPKYYLNKPLDTAMASTVGVSLSLKHTQPNEKGTL